ncbi:helix-turn-helix transcriptional regulator [Paenibacillus sp. 481]|uniref:helix-turn-helix transcriptional regulator n=1 Tax=Paenibacillus sp. 481 TaxID=2835869 RepID=UPI001E4E9E5E|nr:helix-turn-helix transcriptional regulator [Paenibacillus sp. 481]UHA73763.1 helix-turn-helix transcriptional regulator [Paenibacillus sp. 481]
MMKHRKWLILCRGCKTQKEVAVLSGINRSSYSNIETGRRDPSVSVAKRIGQVLTFDWKRFFEESEIKDEREKTMLTANKHSLLTKLPTQS